MNRKKPARKIPNPSDFKAAFCRRTYCNPKQIGGILIAKLIVAEKPSVAMSYAKVLGATNRQDGYLEGNGYLVSWCVGHLVELAPPNVYDAKYVVVAAGLLEELDLLANELESGQYLDQCHAVGSCHCFCHVRCNDSLYKCRILRHRSSCRFLS